jgi:hypothetical protein
MDLNRLRNAVGAVVRELFPNLDYLGVYTYVVASFDEAAQTADLQPLNAKKLPTLTKIPIRTPGLRVKLVKGDQVLVGFQDGDPTQPFVASLMTAKSYSDALNVARQGDMTFTSLTLLQALLPNGSPVPNGYVVIVPPPVPPVPTFEPGVGGVLSFYGVCATGSSFVKSK